MRFNDSLSGSEWRQARDGRDSRQLPETCLMWQCPEKCSGGVHRLQGPPDAVGHLPRTKYRAREELRTLHLTLPLENAKDTHFLPRRYETKILAETKRSTVIPPRFGVYPSKKICLVLKFRRLALKNRRPPPSRGHHRSYTTPHTQPPGHTQYSST